MLTSGLLNPQINALLSRVRHTNLLVIADRGFPFWPQIETVDIALVDDIRTVLQVWAAIRPNFSVGKVLMAVEFVQHNTPAVCAAFAAAQDGTALEHLPQVEFKKLVPGAIGLIRTGDTTKCANLLLESA